MHFQVLESFFQLQSNEKGITYCNSGFGGGRRSDRDKPCRRRWQKALIS